MFKKKGSRKNDILRYIYEHQGMMEDDLPMTILEKMCRHLQMPKSTIYSHLRSMTDEGILVRTEKDHLTEQNNKLKIVIYSIKREKIDEIRAIFSDNEKDKGGS